MRLSRASFFAACLFASACAAPPPDFDDEVSSAASADSTFGEIDAAGRVSARAGVLTLSFDAAASFEDGPRLVLVGRSSRNLTSISSFVPDDAFGQATLTSPRTFELSFRGDHEINTVLSGLPIRLRITTTNGSPRAYQAVLGIGARFVNAAGSPGLRVGPEVRPVHAGPATDPLRYRVRLETTRTPQSVAVSASGVSATSVFARSPRRYEADWTYDAFRSSARAPHVAFTATYGTTSAMTTAAIDLRVQSVGLTTKTIDEVWPEACEPSVRRCLSRATETGATDLGHCGTYRQVTVCANEEPPPPPNVTRAEARIAADVLANTGVRWQPAVLELRPRDGGGSVALTALPRGGLAEFGLPSNGTASLAQITEEPRFFDLNLVQRFEKQLRNQHGRRNARIIAHGTPAGSAPRWHFVVDENGARSTLALEATSESRSALIPFAYDEAAFKEMAGTLAVAHGVALASQAGPYAKLEVYLRAAETLSGPGGLQKVDPAESPVGFDPSREEQVVLPSLWGDNAVYVTIERASGKIRVEDFN